MLTRRWLPLMEMQSEMNRLRDEMEQLFARRSGRSPLLAAPAYPPVNVWKDENNVYVETELPGLELGDLEILVNGNQLTIKGQRRPSQCADGAWHRRERNCGEFTRSLDLPGSLDAERVHAELKHGVLLVTLPERPESRPRRIEVQAE